MADNDNKIIQALEALQAGQKAIQADVKQGQARIEKRLDGLEQGQTRTETALDALKAGQDDIREKLTATKTDVDKIKKGLRPRHAD